MPGSALGRDRQRRHAGDQAEQRRPASYEVFDARNNTRRTEALELVNTIRERVDAWREARLPGVTIVTRKPARALA